MSPTGHINFFPLCPSFDTNLYFVLLSGPKYINTGFLFQYFNAVFLTAFECVSWCWREALVLMALVVRQCGALMVLVLVPLTLPVLTIALEAEHHQQCSQPTEQHHTLVTFPWWVLMGHISGF